MKKQMMMAMTMAMMGGGIWLGHNVLVKDASLVSEAILENIEALADIEIDLPEVTITCDNNQDRCWKFDPKFYMEGEHMFQKCYFTGYQNDYCKL